MTDPKPDPLFDALREQLADYGQEPPAQLWAGIRQQLPPPMAGPQRRRRRGAGLLLGLLLLLVSVGGWLATPPGAASRRAGLPGGPAVAPSTPSRASASQAAATSPPLAAAEQAAAVPGGSSPSSAAPAGPTPGGASASPDALAVQPAAGQPVAPAAAAMTGAGQASAAEHDRTSLPLIAAAPSAQPTRYTARHSAGIVVANAWGRPGERARRRRAGLLLAATSTSSKTGQAPSHTAGRPATSAASASTSTPTAAGQPASTQSTADALTASVGADAGQSVSVANANVPTSQAAGLVASTLLATSPAAGAVRPLATNELALHPVSLLLPSWPAPAVRVSADTLPRRVLPPVRRWAVQVLLGPSLSYRQLTPAASLATAPSTIPSNLPSSDIRVASSTDVATLERPTLGFSGQVQLRRVLTGRWALTGGLGYRQYATALALQLYRPLTPYGLNNMAPVISDSSHIGSIERRNTYGYLTVPVQASYALGAGWGRLQPSLLAGAELGLYLGGTTTEGPACNCPARTWTATNSPYRPLSLALTLGLELRYRPGGAWELLAQPTFTYGLTSVVRPGSTYAERRPYAAGLQLGVAYYLR